MDILQGWLSEQGLTGTQVRLLTAALGGVGLILLAVVTNWITRRVILRVLSSIVRRSGTTWDDAFLDHRVFHRLSHLAPALLIAYAGPRLLAGVPTAAAFASTFAFVYLVVVGVGMITGTLNALSDLYERTKLSERIYIKTFVQVLKLVVYLMTGVLLFSQLLGKSPIVFFSGLGAFTAVLLLVFKDVILGLVAGIQLMSFNMVRKGDWIEMPRFGADGDVIDVSLTTVKVQNWDKTISTIPTYSLISDSFRNWRGMSESGGRRIKRSVALDMNSVQFCDQEALDRFRRVRYIQDYIERKVEELAEHNRKLDVDEASLVNGRHLTNVGTFRAYLEAYLRNHPMVHQELTLLVRQLPPGPEGLPIEIYAFSRDQNWSRYEAIQADIMDHILAVVPLFDLRVFQSPTGGDVRALSVR